MKNKFFKLLSTMLAIMIVVSGFAGVLSVSATTPTTATYYVSASGSNENDGLEKTPFQTIGGALTAAVADAEAGNYNNAESTVYLKVLGTDAVDCALNGISHNFKLNISSADVAGSAVLNVATGGTNKASFCGPTTLSNITMNVADWGEVYANGVDFIVEDSATINYAKSTAYFMTGLDVPSITKTQNIVFKSDGTVAPTYMAVGGNTTTYEADLNFTYNAPNISQTILMDSGNKSTTNTINKNLNMNFVAAAGITLNLRGSVSPNNPGTGKIVFGSEAAFQIINSTGNAVNYSNIESSLPEKTYVITNNTGIKDFVKFTETAGTYTIGEIPADHVLYVTPKGGEAYTPDSSTLTLQPGEYTLSLVDTSAKPKDVIYYVSANGSNDNDGLAESRAFKTVGGALTKAVAAADAGKYNIAESNIYLKLIGTEPITYSDASGVAFDFKLNISSATSGALLDNGAKSALIFGGPVVFENLSIQMYFLSGTGDEYYLNGENVTFGTDVTWLHPTESTPQTYFCTGAGGASKQVTETQTVNFYNSGRFFQYFTLGGGKTTTYDADLNLIYTAPGISQDIKFDTVSSSAVAKYNKNVNIDLREAGGINFVGRAGNPRISFGENSAVQILNSTGKAVTYDANIQAALFGDAALTDTYVITNLTGVKDIIAFTETAGTYTVKEGYKVTAVAPDKSTIVAEGQLKLPAVGEYKLIVEKDPDPATNNYSEYINKRGNNLKNTYLKLKNKEDINVVYFGGSVTGGSGANAPDADSWRAKVGNWLTENFPISSINNMNFAIGGTGTLLGAYRVEEEVLPTQPDLVFVEFAINDRYNGATTEQAKTRFETIVRKIRAAYPDCDIVTLLVTDNSTFNDDLNDALFTQAQAHEDISIAYGIPSIYIGRALSDTVADKANWGNYYADSVHPNEAGYEVHYNVIKEYLNNELNHGNYEGEVANHTVPEQVSKTLLDGDVDLIKVDQAFIDASTAKGGVGFTFNSGIHQFGGNKDYNAFVGAGENIDITSDGNDYAEVGKFVFEFTGTELAVLSMGTHVAGYSVKVDGGEAYEVSLSGNFVPYVLATGLKSATHTVEVSPIYRTCNPHCGNSHVDWVYAFFTSDATKSSHTHDYGEYVPNGDATCDTDGTKSAICSICLNTDTVADVGSAGHKFTNYVSDGNATCTEDGTKTATCDRDGCGAKSEPIADVGSAGHKFTNYVNDNNATCAKDGTKTAICDRDGCEAKDVVTIAGTKKAHTYSNACDTSCNVCKAIRKVAAHKYSNSCDTSCNICGAKRSVSHDYDMYKVKKATPEKDGKKYYKCEDCGATKTTTIYKVTKIKLSTTKYTYNGKSKKPSVTVYDSKGNKISSKYYDVKYASGRKMVGKYKVTVKLEGKYYDDDLKTYFTINPGKTSVSKVSAAKKSLKVTVKKKSTQVTGYQIEYSTSKTFKDKYTKSKTIKKYSTTSVTLKSLKAKKTYYVRVRTYKTVDGKKYYSAWSDYKAKKTK
ncbi:MAG: fibronectin type III domain-containing protein [Clostridia bacterium]|nr:fibronectin type III domain-containing protein [Clostridia bacterium]